MEHRHELDSNGAIKSKTNIVLIIFLIISAFFMIGRTSSGGFPIGLIYYC